MGLLCSIEHHRGPLRSVMSHLLLVVDALAVGPMGRPTRALALAVAVRHRGAAGTHGGCVGRPTVTAGTRTVNVRGACGLRLGICHHGAL